MRRQANDQLALQELQEGPRRPDRVSLVDKLTSVGIERNAWTGARLYSEVYVRPTGEFCETAESLFNIASTALARGMRAPERYAGEWDLLFIDRKDLSRLPPSLDTSRLRVFGESDPLTEMKVEKWKMPSEAEIVGFERQLFRERDRQQLTFEQFRDLRMRAAALHSLRNTYAHLIWGGGKADALEQMAVNLAQFEWGDRSELKKEKPYVHLLCGLPEYRDWFRTHAAGTPFEQILKGKIAQTLDDSGQERFRLIAGWRELFNFSFGEDTKELSARQIGERFLRRAGDDVWEKDKFDPRKQPLQKVLRILSHDERAVVLVHGRHFGDRLAHYLEEKLGRKATVLPSLKKGEVFDNSNTPILIANEEKLMNRSLKMRPELSVVFDVLPANPAPFHASLIADQVVRIAPVEQWLYYRMNAD